MDRIYLDQFFLVAHKTVQLLVIALLNQIDDKEVERLGAMVLCKTFLVKVVELVLVRVESWRVLKLYFFYKKPIGLICSLNLGAW